MLTLVALFLGPVFAFQSIIQQFAQIQSAYQSGLSLEIRGELKGALRGFESKLGASDEELEYLELVSALELEEASETRSSFGGLGFWLSKQYFGELVRFDQASYAVSVDEDGRQADVETVLRDIEGREVPAKLKELYRTINGIDPAFQDWEKPMPRGPDGEPREHLEVLFVYGDFEFDGGTVTIFYPGAEVDDDFDSREREWSQGKGLKFGEEFEVTRIYRDYSSTRPILSFCYSFADPLTKRSVMVIADFPVDYPGAVSLVHILNILACLLALLAFVKYYSTTPLAFQAHLAFASGTLVAVYVAFLVVSRVWGESGVEWFVENVVPFTPTDSFFIVAGRSLRLKRVRQFSKEFPKIYLIQTSLSVLGLIWLPHFHLGFSIFALAYFGQKLWATQSELRQEAFSDLTPQPRHVAIAAGFAMFVWSFSQLAQVAMRKDLPVLRKLTHRLLAVFYERSDLILSEIGALTYLAYAKIFALGMCVMYVSTLEKARNHRLRKAGRPRSFLRVAPDGQILDQGEGFGQGFESLEGENILHLIEDDRDREELAGVLSGDCPLLYDLRVRMPRIKEHIVRLEVDREPESTFRVSVYTSMFRPSGLVDLHQEKEIWEYLRATIPAAETDAETDAPGEGEVQSALPKAQEPYIERVVTRLMQVFAGDGTSPGDHETKNSGKALYEVFAETVRAGAERARVEVQDLGGEEARSVVQLNTAAWRSILSPIMSELKDLGLSDRHELRISAGLQPMIEFSLKPKRFFFDIRITPALGLAQKVNEYHTNAAAGDQTEVGKLHVAYSILLSWQGSVEGRTSSDRTAEKIRFVAPCLQRGVRS